MKYAHDYEIQEQHLDFRETLRPVSLMSLMLETAGLAADAGGFGIKEVMSKGHTWVISRLSARIGGTLSAGDRARCVTWIHGCDGPVTTRYIQLTGPEGDEVAACVSNWSLIDLQTRRPMNLSAIPGLSDLTEPDRLDLDTVRLVVPAGGETRLHRINYNDIDFNRHAHSMRYLEWMLEDYPRAFLESRRLARLDLNYQREGHWEDEVTITRQTGADGDLFDLSTGGKTLCKARLGWI